MRYLKTSFSTTLLLMFAFGRSGLAQNQISASGNIVTTTPVGSTGISATAAAATPDVAVKTGDASTSAFHIFNSANAELLRVQADGNVGIGSAAAGAPLHVVRADIAPKIRAAYNTTFYLDIGHYFIDVENNPLSFRANGVDRMIMSSDGNFGIGTSTSVPLAAPLHVVRAELDPKLRAAFNSFYYLDIGHYFLNSHNNPLIIRTNEAERMRVDATTGFVGIDTAAPTSTLQIGATYPAKFQELPTNGVLLDMAANSEIHIANLQIGMMATPVIQTTGSGASPLYLNKDSDNDVIIGASGHTKGLKVEGANVTSTFAGSVTVTGTLTAGTVYANYQDVAEWVPAEGNLSPGTVVVLNRAKTNAVSPSLKAYDTAVAGVVSEAPGVLLGVAGSDKAKIATTGRVKVRVDARTHPVGIGDLLVTSDIPGTAMVSEPMDINGRRFHQPGTLIGKALEPLPSGEGTILVLLSLQ
ncbi:MAG TPA: hypothetical protein VGQ46_10480 [Thermoanaerobaculia bacterium]|nr:hypothetical protein [Thermoanaerobaculia bacterium]